ncbi:MAG: hypothetical protein ABI083_11680, partial [Lapillicoccus sp.]
LERQYDTFMEGRQRPSLLATEISELPSADEIGAELEAFLQGVAEDETEAQQQGSAEPGADDSQASDDEAPQQN